ncbi:MAG: hypothetical protein R3C68_14200 [Myxococcota bacterium]
MLGNLDSHSLESDSDRRDSARARLFTLVQSADGKGALWAWDVGLGGMQCHASHVRMAGTFMDLTLRLPGSEDILHIGAQVISFDQTSSGKISLALRFCRLSMKATLAIYRFLDSRRALWDRATMDAARPETLFQ